MKTELVPVYEENGNILLYDMYVNGNWIGSRRTVEQCDRILEELKNKQ